MEIKRRLRILLHKLKKLIKLKETPEAIALGAAIGFFWNFVPSVGLGAFLSFFIARFFKASGVAAATFNLATGFFIPIYYSLNLITGRFLTGHRITTEEIGDQIGQSLDSTVAQLDTIVEEPLKFFSLAKLQNLSWDFAVGAIVNGVFFAILIYFAFIIIIKSQRKLKEKKKETTSQV